MSQEWIYLVTASKTPSIRTNGSPFETYPDGFDPNAPGTFGPTEDNQFLPVTRLAEPTVDPILNKTVQASTQSDIGQTIAGEYITPGTYAAGDWVVSWSTVDQDLAVSKELKLEEVLADKLVALGGGYDIGEYNLPFTEEYFAALTSRKVFMSAAIVEGDITGTDTIVLKDSQGKKAELTNAQFQNHYSLYGLAYTDIAGIEVAAGEEIEAATTPVEVDAVTWDFEP